MRRRATPEELTERLRPKIATPVHYVSHGTPVREDGTQAFTAQCRAAVVTDVHPETCELVKLCVFNPGGVFHTDWLEYEPGTAVGGSWHWGLH